MKKRRKMPSGTGTWNAIIRDRALSGLTVNQYCVLHGLSRDSYYYWFKKIKREELLKTAERIIKENKDDPEVSEYRSVFEPQMIIRTAGADFLIGSNTPGDLIARVLQLIHK